MRRNQAAAADFRNGTSDNRHQNAAYERAAALGVDDARAQDLAEQASEAARQEPQGEAPR